MCNTGQMCKLLGCISTNIHKYTCVSYEKFEEGEGTLVLCFTFGFWAKVNCFVFSPNEFPQ